MWDSTCNALIYKIFGFSWQRGSLICHHIPQLKGRGGRDPMWSKEFLSHVKLKSTQTNIIEPLPEHEVWLTLIQVHVSFLKLFFFSFLCSINHALFPNRLIVISTCRGGMHQPHTDSSIFGRASRVLWSATSICQVVHTEILQQPLDGLRWNFVEYTMSRIGCMESLTWSPTVSLNTTPLCLVLINK